MPLIVGVKEGGIPCSDLNPYFDEYDAILNSQAKTKKQYKGEKMTKEAKERVNYP